MGEPPACAFVTVALLSAANGLKSEIDPVSVDNVPVAFCKLTETVPSSSWKVISVDTLSEFNGSPYFTDHIHGLEVLVTSSLPPSQFKQLSHRIFAVVRSLLKNPLP